MNAAKTIKDYEALFDDIADHFDRAPMDEVELVLREADECRRNHKPRRLVATTCTRHEPLPTSADMMVVFDRAGRGAERWALVQMRRHHGRCRRVVSYRKEKLVALEEGGPVCIDVRPGGLNMEKAVTAARQVGERSRRPARRSTDNKHEG